MGYKASDHTFAICAHKESPYLEECIESVMTQTVKGEVIICTSTPNDHIAAMADKYDIPLFVSKEAGGIGSDWNFAYNSARTELVTLAHQDDIYERTFIESTLRQIGPAKTPLIAFTDYYEIWDDRIATHRNFVNLRIKRTMLLPLRNKKLRSGVWMRRLLLSFADPICCPSVTYVKENLPDRLFDEELSGSIDWAAWERISGMRGSFVYIPHMLMGHRMYTGSSTLNLISSGKRKREDYEVLCLFWPAPLAKAINELYSHSQKKRKKQ